MESNDSDILLPFGRTSVSKAELHSLIDIETAVNVLKQEIGAGACDRVSRFIEQQPTLLAWLADNGRKYPWRLTQDPWRVYISEILLQRTRADAVADIYNDFFNLFPGPDSLNRASENEIKQMVKSLGFSNHRTRTLQDVAQLCKTEHEGNVPESLAELQQPWRVGPYTARATMMFAFNKPVALVDTNVARVTERVFGFEMPSQPHKSDHVYRFMDALVPDDPAVCRAINLSFLDLADAICTPESPDCQNCPLGPACAFWS